MRGFRIMSGDALVMTWYYLQGDQTVGPVPESELEGLIQGGTLSPDVQVWREGMADWQSYGVLKAAAAPTPAPSPGLRIARHEAAPASVATVAESGASGGAVIESAPLGQRIVAKIIDVGFVTLCIVIVVVFCEWIASLVRRAGGPQNFEKSFIRSVMRIGASLGGVCIGWIIKNRRETHREDSVKRSMGKRLMKIAIVDMAGRPLSGPTRFSRVVIQLLMVGLTFFVVIAPLLMMANRPPGPMRPVVYTPGRPPAFERPPSRAARLFVPFLTALLLSQLGYAVALFNRERRGLHDLICRTRVIVCD